MTIETEKQITPLVAKSIREQSGMTQRKFWESVGSNQTSGHWFENGKRDIIPKPLRMLIFLRYVALIDFDLSSADTARQAVSIGREISARLEAQRLEAEAKRLEQQTKETKQRASELMRKSKQMSA